MRVSVRTPRFGELITVPLAEDVSVGDVDLHRYRVFFIPKIEHIVVGLKELNFPYTTVVRPRVNSCNTEDFVVFPCEAQIAEGKMLPLKLDKNEIGRRTTVVFDQDFRHKKIVYQAGGLGLQFQIGPVFKPLCSSIVEIADDSDHKGDETDNRGCSVPAPVEASDRTANECSKAPQGDQTPAVHRFFKPFTKFTHDSLPHVGSVSRSLPRFKVGAAHV